MIGIVSGTVSASARSMGHVISFWITFCLMLLVFCVLGKEAFWGPRSYAPCKTRYGPLVVFSFAALLIMVDPSRHVMGDMHWWPWCGNNPQFNRINETSGWGAQCTWSSTQYQCSTACCVSTWQNTTDASSGASAKYEWMPPSADFWSDPSSVAEAIPGPFLTQRPDLSVYAVDGFYEAASAPYQLYPSTVDKPLTFWETGEVNPLEGGKTDADCAPYGVNPHTGYCFMTNQSLSYKDQLAQLGQWGAALADPTLPFDKDTNSYVCGCNACAEEVWDNLSTVGILSTILCTYLGFILLAVAVGWNANIVQKFAKIGAKWKKLRGAYNRSSVQQTTTGGEYVPASVP